MSVITFSIVITISLACSSLVLSNSKIEKLEYTTEKLRERNLGLIEIIYSNLLIEIKNAIQQTKTPEEFYLYLTKNNGYSFINKVKNIQGENIQMVWDNEVSTKEHINYKILCKSEIGIYEKDSLIKLEIKNPWISEETIDVLDEYELIELYRYEEK